MDATRIEATIRGSLEAREAERREMNDRLHAIPTKYAQPDASLISHIPKGGVQLEYVGHADITLALIDVDPGWTWAPAGRTETGAPVIEERGNRLVMWGTLTVCGVTRECVGTCEARKADPEKELIGDLLRNGAMRFGIGTKLWSKADGDPAGSGGSGGYERHQPTLLESVWQKVKATKGTPLEAELRRLADENGKALTPKALHDDPVWFELVEATVTQ